MGKKALTKKQIRQIISLRERGCSLPEIRRTTKHGSGTIFKYIKNVEILPAFQEFWNNKRKSSIARSFRQKQEAKEQANRFIKKLTDRDKILIGASLYWAEGAKRDFSLSNTDPDLIKIFVDSLKQIGIERKDLSINLRIYEDLDKKEACKFWSKIVGIPRKKIIYVDVRKGKKQGKLKYGMCRLRVIKGGYYLKLLNAIKNIIIDNASPL